MSKELAPVFKALLKTADEVGVLFKNKENKHSKYDYVAIDDFYEIVATKARSNGLSWKLVEENYEWFGEKVFVPTYKVDLIHESGITISDFSRITVPHPLQGAQTSGSAISYAEKMFMRMAFKVVTGEEDADATDPKEVVKVTSKPVPISADNILQLTDVAWRAVGTEQPPFVINTDTAMVLASENGLNTADILDTSFRLHMPMHKTKDELRDFWKVNAAARDLLRNLDNSAYSRLVADFTDTADKAKG